MSIKDIITVPNEILKKISEPIEKVGVPRIVEYDKVPGGKRLKSATAA